MEAGRTAGNKNSYPGADDLAFPTLLVSGMRFVVIRVILFAFYLAPLTFASESKCPESALAIPVCNILADAAKYDGKDVAVRGLYYRVTHGSILTAPACEKLEGEHALSPGLEGREGRCRCAQFPRPEEPAC